MKSYSYYRAQAEEALQFALVPSQEMHREAFLGLARAWQELAEAAEQREARSLQRLSGAA